MLWLSGGALIFFSYMIIETWRYMNHVNRIKRCRFRVSESDNICSGFMDEIIDNVKKQKDVIKNLSYVFDPGTSKDTYVPNYYSLLNDVTRHMMHDMILQNTGCNDRYNDKNREQKIEELIDVYENKISQQMGCDFKFTNTSDNKPVDQYIPGRGELTPYFKPLLILGIIKMIKILGSLSLWRKGFVSILGDHGMNYIVKKYQSADQDVASKSNRTLLFFHGIGIGITPYINFVDIFQSYDQVIIVELPNIGYGRYVEDYPSSRLMCESVLNHLTTHNPDVCKNITFNPAKIDLAGHSYGSLLVSYLLRSKRFTDTINYDKVYLLDSICFQESTYKPCRVMLFNLKQFVTFERTNVFGSIKEIMKTIERVIQYLLIFGDIETQIVIKRTMFLNELSFPIEMLRENVMVVIAEFDMFINTSEVVNILKTTPVKLMVMKDTCHADMVMIATTREKVKHVIEKFIASYPDINEHNNKISNDSNHNLSLDFEIMIQ